MIKFMFFRKNEKSFCQLFVYLNPKKFYCQIRKEWLTWTAAISTDLSSLAWKLEIKMINN